MDMARFHEWAAGLNLIVCVEEKRKIIEGQIKDALFDAPHGRRVYGWHKGNSHVGDRREELLPTRYALDPIRVAETLGAVLIEEGRRTDAVAGALAKLAEARRADNAEATAARLPCFCSGCPHNSSTAVPEGSRAYAGIGCHYMVQWMDRETSGSRRWAARARTGWARRRFQSGPTCSRTSATAPTTIPACRRSALP
jgi:indolepyruvate ferredoxin oxidoreductase